MAEPMSDERLQELKETNRILRRTGMAQLIAEVERLREELKREHNLLVDCRTIHHRVEGWLEVERENNALLAARLAAADKLIEGWDFLHDAPCLDYSRECTCGLWDAERAYRKLKEPNSNKGES